MLVATVRRSLLDLSEEALLNVELSYMGDCASLNGVVGKKFSTVVDDSWSVSTTTALRSCRLTVEMVGAANIVARNDCDESCRAVGCSGLHTAESISLDSSSRAIAVAFGLNAGIYTSGIGAPKFDIGIGNRLAVGSVYYVDVEMGDGSFLACKDILTDKLTSDP